MSGIAPPTRRPSLVLGYLVVAVIGVVAAVTWLGGGATETPFWIAYIALRIVVAGAVLFGIGRWVNRKVV